MGSVELVPAEVRHIGGIARRMRPDDVLECRAVGHDPKQALRIGLRQSLWSLTALIDGKPEAMMGVVPVNLVEGVGCPFLLGTDAVYGEGRAMLVKGAEVIAAMTRTLPVLENMVAAANVRAIRLLGRWGFCVGDDPVDVGGVPFLRFRMEAG